jgi:magnesium-transporting ATPase (P-type)
MDKKITL